MALMLLAGGGTWQDRAPFAGISRIRFQGSCLNRRCSSAGYPWRFTNYSSVARACQSRALRRTGHLAGANILFSFFVLRFPFFVFIDRSSPMRPADTEFAPFYAAYIARVPETDPLPALEAQPAELLALADRIAPDEELFRYAPDKWTVRQTFGHLIDTERVMGYRAFCIGRGEVKPLPGFDEKEYVAHAVSNDRTV